ncbi:MAG: CHAT domain-containing protein [Anaerolineae bacterium]|nr:CHAT domain-containing protein [Anaerolineae bacterium]
MQSWGETFEHLVSIVESGERPVLETRVVSSSYGSPRQRSILPYTAGQIEALLRVIERPALPAADMASHMPALQSLGWAQDGRLILPWPELLQRIGRELYESLFPRGPVRTALNVALSQARRRRAALAFQLHLDREAGLLARLPWELLHDDHGYLVQSGRLALARYIAFKAPLTPVAVQGPLRVLVIVSRPAGLPVLDGEAEPAALRSGLAPLVQSGTLEVDLLEPPTWRSFVDALCSRPYHIVHFDGHGDFGRLCPACRHLAAPSSLQCLAGASPGRAPCGANLGQTVPQGYLAFERPGGGVDWRSASNLAAALFRNPQVRLAVLSACRSAAVSSALVFSGAGPALIGAGVPAVVAMQCEVPLYATVAFAGAFYAAVAERLPLIEAMARARAHLDDETWYRPSLYLRGRNDPRGVLFD